MKRRLALNLVQLDLCQWHWLCLSEMTVHFIVQNGTLLKVKASTLRSCLISRCCCSVAQSCLTLCDPMDRGTPGFPVLHHLPEPAQTPAHWVHNAIQPSRPLSSPSPPAFCLSQYQGLFHWVSSSHQVAKVLELHLHHQSFRIDWFALVAVQGILKSLLQRHSSKESILWCLTFFMVQLSHPYTTTGKTIASTLRTFVSKVMSLLFNVLSRLVIAFLPRSKRLLISWLHSLSMVILEPKRNKVFHCLQQV